MAVRLTVVVSQAAGGSAADADLEETIVAELMMSPGIDATMVGPIERVQSEDTDFLCLSSFQHNFVVLTWLSAAELAEHWSRLGLSGQVVGEETEVLTPGKRVFHRQMRAGATIESLMEDVKRVLADRQVKTVSLGGADSNLTDAGVQAASEERLNAASDRVKSESQRTDSDPQTRGKEQRTEVEDKQIDKPAPSLAAHVDPDDEGFEHLDQLVDDFDALDL